VPLAEAVPAEVAFAAEVLSDVAASVPAEVAAEGAASVPADVAASVAADVAASVPAEVASGGLLSVAGGALSEVTAAVPEVVLSVESVLVPSSDEVPSAPGVSDPVAGEQAASISAPITAGANNQRTISPLPVLLPFIQSLLDGYR